jgi:predicted amidohydrolase YtcJ
MGLTANCALPLRIEHVQLIDPQDLQRLASSGIVASMQPIHATSDRDMADRHWGERCVNAYAWKSTEDSGARMIFGSDAPVESPNPYWGLHAALTRKAVGADQTTESWYPRQCLSMNAALQAYITQPHDVAGKGQRLGRLMENHLADLNVFSSDLLQSDPADIAQMKPHAVMVDGKWVSISYN